MTVVGIGIGMVCSSFGLIYVEDIPPEHVGRMFGISPILATGAGGSIGGAVFGAFLSSNTLPPVHGAPPGPPLPSIHAFEGFWALAAGLSLLGACFAAGPPSAERCPRSGETTAIVTLQDGSPSSLYAEPVICAFYLFRCGNALWRDSRTLC